jgi:hypothetical protein
MSVTSPVRQVRRRLISTTSPRRRRGTIKSTNTNKETDVMTPVFKRIVLVAADIHMPAIAALALDIEKDARPEQA